MRQEADFLIPNLKSLQNFRHHFAPPPPFQSLAKYSFATKNTGERVFAEDSLRLKKNIKIFIWGRG